MAMTEAATLSPRAKAVAAAQGAFSWLRTHPLLWSGGLFAAALVACIVFQASIIPSMGLWYDELFSLWAGDPGISFGEAFATRILPDTNGPIYFSLVYFAQLTGLSGRAAFVVLNFLVISAVFAMILARGRLARIPATALCAVTIALITAPLLVYGPEGRVYGIVMAVCAAIAFEAGRTLAGGEAKPNDLILAAVLGALTAWMHVFGAIFTGSLAAALVITGALILRRRDVVLLGLVFGAATTIAFVIWIAFAFRLFTGTASWIIFDREWVFNAIWTLKHYLVGPIIGAVAAFSFVALSLIPRNSRAMALVLAITGGLFITIPLVVSIKMPIFLGRYLLVAGPGLLVLCVFLLRSHLVADGAPKLWRAGLGTLGALFFVFPLMQGLPTVSQTFADRSSWEGERPVLEAAGACPAGEIRTLSSIPLKSGFEFYLRGKLTPVEPDLAPMRDVSEIDCPVFGWAEHFSDAWVEKASVGRVLNDFHLTNKTGLPLEIIPHRAGLVLARADAKLR